MEVHHHVWQEMLPRVEEQSLYLRQTSDYDGIGSQQLQIEDDFCKASNSQVLGLNRVQVAMRQAV